MYDIDIHLRQKEYEARVQTPLVMVESNLLHAVESRLKLLSLVNSPVLVFVTDTRFDIFILLKGLS
jgi:hypothetical protein